MELKVNSKVLDGCLSSLKRITPSRSSIEVLTNLLFKVYEDHMTISSSDMEIFMEIQIPCVSDGVAVFMVPAKYLFTLASGLPDQELSFVFEENNIKVSYDSGHFMLPIVHEVKLFPEPYVKGEDVVVNRLSAEVFSRSFALIAPFTEKPDDSIDAVYSSGYFEFSDKGVCVVGTNGNGLALREISLENVTPTSFLVSAKAVSMLRIFNSLPTDQMLTITSDDRNVFIESDLVRLSMRRTSARFPNFRSVIPDSANVSVEIDRKSLMSSLQRMDSISYNHYILADFKESNVNLIAENLDFGIHSEDAVSCDVEGDGITVGFNGMFLHSAAKVLGGDRICLDFVNSSSAAKLYPVANNDSYKDLILLMPMALQ